MGSPVDRVQSSYASKFGIALVVVAAVVAVGGAVVHVQTSEQLADDVEGQLTETTTLRASELDTWLESVTKQTRATSRHPVFQTDDPDRIKPYLESMVRDGRVPDGVVAVHYLDATEMRIVTSSADRMVGISPREQGAAFAEDPPSFDGPDDVAVTKPFRVPVVEFPVVAVISPVPGVDHKAVIFMIDLERRMASFSDSVDGETMMVVDGRGTYVAHPDAEMLLSTREGGGEAPVVQRALGGEVGVASSDDGATLTAYAPLETVDWVVLREVPSSSAFSVGRTVTNNIVVQTVLALLALAAIGLTIGRNTVASLRELSAKADHMAQGDLDVALATDRRDEIGTLFESFDRMRASLRQQIEEADRARADAERARERAEQINVHLEAKAERYRDAMRAAAGGDLTRRVDVDSHSDSMVEIGEALNEMIADLERTVSDVLDFARNVSDAATTVEGDVEAVKDTSGNVSGSVQAISDGAARQTENVEEVSMEMDDLTASAEEIAATADHLATLSERAAAAGAEGREAAEDALEEIDPIERKTERTVEQIERLEGEMQAIGEIVELITEIAEQTDMLALNASIEAARTGQEGAGFAVVADEIKRLAEEVGESAEQIEDRIESIQSQTVRAVEDMRGTSERIASSVDTVDAAIDALRRIVDHVEETDANIQEINDATEDQASSTQKMVSTIDEVADISGRTATEAESVAAAAREQTSTLTGVTDRVTALAEQAENLQALLENFEVADGGSSRSAGDGVAGGAGSDAPASTDGGRPES